MNIKNILLILIIIFLINSCDLFTHLSEDNFLDKNSTGTGTSTNTQIFTENFDSTPINQIPGGFYIYGGDANTFIGIVNSGITSHSLPNCLEISDNSNVNSIQIRRYIKNQPYGQLTYYLYIKDSSPWSGTAIGNVIQVFFNSLRNITVVQPNGTLLNIGTYTTETWNKVEIKWDAYTLRYKVIFNDVDLRTYQFQINEIPAGMGIAFTQGLDAGHLNYVDDVTFTINLETIN